VTKRIGERARRARAPKNANATATVPVVNIVIVVPKDGVRGVEGTRNGGGFSFIGPVDKIVRGDEGEVVHVITGLAGDVV
jgi:hypothetical protein